MKQYSLIVAVAIALLFGIYGSKYLFKGSMLSRFSGQEDGAGLAVDILQTLTLERVDTKAVSIPDFKGRPLMINFWASWCGPCMTEMPSIYALHKRFRDKGFEVLAINLDVDAVMGTRALAKRFGKPEFRIVRGHDEKYADIFEIEGVPYTLLIDRDGKIRYAKAGERDWLDDKSIKLVEGIL